MGWDVALPLTESGSYDLIVDDGDGLHRVQCRFASAPDVPLRRIHSNAKGYVVKKTEANEYDWLYVLRPDGVQYLIRECLVGRTGIRPKPEHMISSL